MRRHTRTLLVIGLGVGLMALFLRNADLGRVWFEIRTARWGLLVGAVVASAACYLVRVIRWQRMLEPIGSTRFSVAFRATVIGFAVTSILPGRVGEVLRPYLLARREGMSATAVFATIILERVLDVMTVLLLFSVFLLFFDPGMAAVDGRLLRALKVGGLLAALVAVAGFGVMVAAAGHPERIGRAVLRADGILPGWIARGLSVLSRRFTEGLAVVRHPKALLASLAWSVPLWLLVALGIWLVSTGFGLEVPFTGCFLLMLLLVLGVAVPTPAGIGSFHAAFQIGVMTFYGASNESAVGAALVLHAVSFVPVTLVGILLMAQEGVRLKGVRELVSTVDPPPAAGAEEPEADPQALEQMGLARPGTHDEGSAA